MTTVCLFFFVIGRVLTRLDNWSQVRHYRAHPGKCMANAVYKRIFDAHASIKARTQQNVGDWI